MPEKYSKLFCWKEIDGSGFSCDFRRDPDRPLQPKIPPMGVKATLLKLEIAPDDIIDTKFGGNRKWFEFTFRPSVNCQIPENESGNIACSR